MLRDDLLGFISPPLDSGLAKQLITEFTSIEKRFSLGDWEPATLDGGQFAEIASRIIYHIDSGLLDSTRSVHDSLTYVEDSKGLNSHSYPDRKSAQHTSRIIRSIYKFRSDRGAVHIDPSYTANHLDSKLVLENCRWVMSEILRIFWTNDRSKVASLIRDLIEFDQIIIGDYDGTLLVHNSGCTAGEEILLLLHHVGNKGLSRKDLGSYVRKSAPSITNSLKDLVESRLVIPNSSGNYRLTQPGELLVRNELSRKFNI
jgi:hypothetical protein